MAAFTRLSPLHISLPIRLTTRIHTQWLHPPFSPFSSNSPLPSHFSSARHTTGFILSHLAPFPPPSYVLHFFFASHFHCISCFSLSLPLHLFFFFHIQYRYPVPVLSIHTKEDQVRQRSDSIKRMSGLTVHTSAARRGYVGVLLFLA